MFRFLFCIVTLAYTLCGQTINQQLTDRSTIIVTHNGMKFQFTIAEVKALYADLHAQSDPALPENSYFPAKLKEKLIYLRTKAYVIENPGFPKGWESGHNANGSLTFAESGFCSLPINGKQSPISPCVTVYPTILMMFMRSFYPMSLKPDRSMKNTFAVSMGHESIHLERGATFWTTLTLKSAGDEEVRCWFRTLKDFVEPLRAAKEPISKDFTDLDDMLKPCGGKLPCKKFEDYVRQYKADK